MNKYMECDICGERHDPEEHGTPIVLLQPSLHTVDEFNEEAIGQMAALEPDNAKVQKLYKEYEALPEMERAPRGSVNHARPEDSEALQEICDDMMRALEHQHFFGEDTFAIYEK